MVQSLVDPGADRRRAPASTRGKASTFFAMAGMDRSLTASCAAACVVTPRPRTSRRKRGENFVKFMDFLAK